MLDYLPAAATHYGPHYFRLARRPSHQFWIRTPTTKIRTTITIAKR